APVSVAGYRPPSLLQNSAASALTWWSIAKADESCSATRGGPPIRRSCRSPRRRADHQDAPALAWSVAGGLLGPHHGVTDGRREIVRGELPMRGHQLTDCILEGFTAAGRPEQETDQAVAHDTQRCFLGTSYNCLKIVQRVESAGKCKERYREPGDVPEIPSGSTRHHVGAEADKNAHADQEQPAILCEHGNESDGRQTPQERPGQPQQAVVQRFPDGRQGTESHGKSGPISIFPVHGKGDGRG